MTRTLSPGVRCVTAPNPSPMTGDGTNSYILGEDSVLIIDPGPILEAHHQALLAAVKGQKVAGIFVTHAHRDHSPLAHPLARELGCKVFAFGGALDGQSELMQKFRSETSLGGGEGLDLDFQPDVRLADRQVFTWAEEAIEAIWTPGHLSNHMCFAWRDMLFCGDHVMAWSSTLISPPDGDLGAFMRSCDRLLDRPETQYFPGHGAPIADGPARVRWLKAHRQEREAQILSKLADGDWTAQALAEAIYTDVAPHLIPAATRNVLAHLLDLVERKIVTPGGTVTADAKFRRIA